MTYEQTGYARHSDTSKAAGDYAMAFVPSLREKVLAVISGNSLGATAEEIGHKLRPDKQPYDAGKWINPRVSELRAMGLIKDSGARCINSSGHAAVLWVIGRDTDYLKKKLEPKPVGNPELWGKYWQAIYAYANDAKLENLIKMREAGMEWAHDMAHKIFVQSLS